MNSGLDSEGTQKFESENEARDVNECVKERAVSQRKESATEGE